MAANDPGTYVNTPGGRMQAMALAYWNGSAWVGPPTPGTFVMTAGGPMWCGAAFQWNGSAWAARTNLGN